MCLTIRRFTYKKCSIVSFSIPSYSLAAIAYVALVGFRFPSNQWLAPVALKKPWLAPVSIWLVDLTGGDWLQLLGSNGDWLPVAPNDSNGSKPLSGAMWLQLPPPWSLIDPKFPLFSGTWLHLLLLSKNCLLPGSDWFFSCCLHVIGSSCPRNGLLRFSPPLQDLYVTIPGQPLSTCSDIKSENVILLMCFLAYIHIPVAVEGCRPPPCPALLPPNAKNCSENYYFFSFLITA